VNEDHRFQRFIAGLVAAMLLHAGAALAAEGAADAAQNPEGIVFNETMETYTVQRVPTRTLDVVLTSLDSWRHRVLADGSRAEFHVEDGILSMECSACGQGRPSAIEVAKIDLKSVMAYQAGNWNIGIRSLDGAQDFRGLMRGEVGPGPHDPARVSDNKRIALTALGDLYDLAYLTQNPLPAPMPRASAPIKSAEPAAKSGSSEASGALDTAYGARARLQLLAGEVDAALETLSAARRKFGKSVVLRDLETHYVVIGDAYDRLRWGVKLDVPGIRGYLQQIRTLEPVDASPIEQMLAQTLANRIADQHAAGRGAIAEDLALAGRTLFPDHAEMLTRGKSGALPAGGIEVGTAPPL
jgi:hypothetical protein